MRRKVLITDSVHPVMMEGLNAFSFGYEYLPKISLEEVYDKVSDFCGLVINSKIIVDEKLLDRAPNLKFVARLGSGMEIIDQELCKKRGVHVINSPEGNRNAVAEHALGMLLALSNKLVISDKEVRQKIWNREANRGFELQGKTIGIIGFGQTGSTFAKKLSGMQMQILAYDKYKVDYTHAFPYVEACTLEYIMQRADIISFHLPLNEETHHFADEVFFSSLGAESPIIINTSRGGIIDTEALVRMLECEHQTIGGACLDVFENEKPETFSNEEQELYQRLYDLDNVVLSPHVAGWTQESKYKLSAVILERLDAYIMRGGFDE